MFSIGDFSKITGLTVKTLRYYHEQGLLVPTCVDEQTGYRYYDRAKIETARIIAQLRSLDLSIDEVHDILREAVDDADLRPVLERRKALLESTIRRDREIVRSIAAFLTQEQEIERIMARASFQIEEKTIDPVRIAGIRMKGRHSDCGGAFARSASDSAVTHAASPCSCTTITSFAKTTRILKLAYRCAAATRRTASSPATSPAGDACRSCTWDRMTSSEDHMLRSLSMSATVVTKSQCPRVRSI